MLSSFFVG